MIARLSLLLAFTSSVYCAEFSSAWTSSRQWIGPEVWANPLQDWRLNNGDIVGRLGANRTLHLLTHQLSRAAGAFSMEVTVSYEGLAPAPGHQAGFALGLHGGIDDYRHALVWSTHGFQAGLRGDGRLALADEKGAPIFDTTQPVHLRLEVTPAGSATLTGSQGKKTSSLTAELPTADLYGNVALAASGAAKDKQATQSSARFSGWKVAGDRIESHPDHAFGTLLWSQYTLSGGVLKLSAQLAPLQKAGCTQVRLQLKDGDTWIDHAVAPIDELSRTAVFRLDWPSRTAPVEYRLLHDWRRKTYEWSGVIRPEPDKNTPLKIGVFSCDHGYAFPHPHLTANVTTQDPDLMFFAGDQIYEGYGGFGVARIDDTEQAMLDYLRKYYQFGWSWRDLLKDRPSVILPDDHDVFQGNLWGASGRPIPEKKGKRDFASGGYLMPPDWVNAVQRTQTAHLPDPVDPAPVEQGIGVYFTRMDYGAATLAIVEDRKFKTGPNEIVSAPLRRSGDPKALDVPGAELLGPRQEQFLRDWMATDTDRLRVVLSQTIFCKATTHAGGELKPSRFDLDCGGWPQTARDRALSILGPGVVMLHGDQHLGALVRHGVSDWEDGPIGFMAPGTANGFPRAWWPDQPGENHVAGTPEWTGRYLDGLGNRMTLLAAANPEKGSNLAANQSAWNPEQVAQHKGSGYGMVTLNPADRMITFDMWRYLFDATRPQPGDQFEGFPIEVNLP